MRQKTVPIDLALNLAVGSSIVLVGYSTNDDTPFWRAAAFWSLIVFEALVWVPVGAYLLWRFPGWSLMYLVEEATVPTSPLWLAAAYPVAAVAGFLGARATTKRLGWLGPAVFTLVALLLAGAITWFGREQLQIIGTTAEWRAATASRSVFTSSLPYFLVAAALAIIGLWVATLWRVAIVRQAADKKADDGAGGGKKKQKSRGGDTMQLEGGKKGKKK